MDDVYRIRFSVQDTGIGIPQELHQQIFEPFFSRRPPAQRADTAVPVSG
ncbi:ATP-binding protein [Undibacterium arcticum]